MGGSRVDHPSGSVNHPSGSLLLLDSGGLGASRVGHLGGSLVGHFLGVLEVGHFWLCSTQIIGTGSIMPQRLCRNRSFGGSWKDLVRVSRDVFGATFFAPHERVGKRTCWALVGTHVTYV